MIVALALAAAIATPPAPAARVIPERRYDARFVRAIDGDTIEAIVTARATTHVPGGDLELATSTLETIRISGVNAPESTRPQCDAEKKAGLAAKRFLEERLRGESLVFVTRGEEREKFGRALGDIEVGGVSVSQELISKGLADPYDGGKRDPARWCR